MESTTSRKTKVMLDVPRELRAGRTWQAIRDQTIYEHYVEWCEELGLEPADRKEYERVIHAPRWLGSVRTI